MTVTVKNTTKFSCVELVEGTTYEIVSTKKTFIRLRANNTYLPFRLSKGSFKKVFNISEDIYIKLYLGEI